MVTVEYNGMYCDAEIIRFNTYGTRVYVYIPFYYSHYMMEYRGRKPDHKYVWVDRVHLI